jgi:dolichyl-diphosphooligosaccharide--protein glycosyltransferase
VGIFAPMGYFGPLSSRVKGLFIRHIHTGNPLIDSVAEHQATQDGMYWQFFHSVCFIAPLAVPSLLWKRSESKYFLFVYSAVALYFSKKMNRLVLLLAPAASVLAGIAISGIFTWTLVPVWELVESVLSP